MGWFKGLVGNVRERRSKALVVLFGAKNAKWPQNCSRDGHTRDDDLVSTFDRRICSRKYQFDPEGSCMTKAINDS